MSTHAAWIIGFHALLDANEAVWRTACCIISMCVKGVIRTFESNCLLQICGTSCYQYSLGFMFMLLTTILWDGTLLECLVSIRLFYYSWLSRSFLDIESEMSNMFDINGSMWGCRHWRGRSSQWERYSSLVNTTQTQAGKADRPLYLFFCWSHVWSRQYVWDLRVSVDSPGNKHP